MWLVDWWACEKQTDFLEHSLDVTVSPCVLSSEPFVEGVLFNIYISGDLKRK